MTIIVRPALLEDAPEMVSLINASSAQGGTTAHQTAFDDNRMIGHYLAPKLIISCQVAHEGDALLGFQSVKWPSSDSRPKDWGIIATFVKDGQQGKGVGSALFLATRNEATLAGVAAIDATIRADNFAGLAFYEKMGFREDGRLKDVSLTDGTKVDRIQKALSL